MGFIRYAYTGWHDGGTISGMLGGFGGGFFLGMLIFGLVSGLIILLASFMLYNQPQQASSWGNTILIFSLLSLFGMGGFFFGAILGIVGCTLALTWKPSTLST